MLDIGTVKESPGPGTFRLEVGPTNSRDETTLVSLLQKHLELRTGIYSDQWRTSRNLERYGYNHLTFNHSANVVDPITNPHTQNTGDLSKPDFILEVIGKIP